MMSKKFSVALVAAFSFAGVAIATPGNAGDPGVYASLLGGAVITEEAEGNGNALSFKADYDVGFVIAGAVGYNFGNNIRLEGEFAYAETGINRINVTNAGSTGVPLGSGAAAGNLVVRSFLVNGAYDFDTQTKFTPYVLGGFGIAQDDADEIRVSGLTLVNNHDTVVADQLGFGVDYALTDEVKIGASYRYFGTDTPTFNDVALQAFNSELHSHRVLGGVSLKF